MQPKYLKNIEIRSYLDQFEPSNWDEIIEILLLNSIRKIRRSEEDRKTKEENEVRRLQNRHKNEHCDPRLISLKDRENCLTASIGIINDSCKYRTDERIGRYNLEKKLEKLNKELEGRSGGGNNGRGRGKGKGKS